jgi:hypothetical protein
MKPNVKVCGAMLLAFAVAGYAGYAAGEIHQPHMENALSALQNARGELNLAARNKGGHRARAATLVDQAITQVQAGIETREEDAERHQR